MRIVVRGKRWLLRFVPGLANKGDCDAPHVPNKQIRVREGMPLELELDTLVHEVLHAAMWDQSEEAVYATAHAIARVLLRRYAIRRRV